MEYRVIERLARGGMGVVDLARTTDGDLVALKRLVLAGSVDEMERARVRFEREREILATLDHPAIVPLLDVVDDDGELVLVMPFLAGGNLAQRVQEHGPLPATEVKDIARRLLPALAAAHRAGVVHRDLKPGNILFDDRGRPFIADFGVAITQDATPGLTRTGIVLGTPGFLAPEQARGEDVSPAADVASLGATLFFAATGTSPYGAGDPNAVLIRTARGKPDIPRDLDPSLAGLLEPMLDGRVERRPTAAALSGGPDGTLPVPRLARRRQRSLLVGVGAVVAAIAMLALAAGGGGGDDDEVATDDTAAATDDAEPGPLCVPTRYQGCGDLAPAPNSDGALCLEGFADYDEDPTNGCEAEPDDTDGTELDESLMASIVPATDEDRFSIDVDDGGDLDVFCANRLTVRLIAPTGMELELRLLDPDGEVVGRAQTTTIDDAVVRVRDPNCGSDDSGTYTAEVVAVGLARTAAPYRLERSGRF